MIIPKLQILAESENWIVAVDREVTICELFDSYNGRGKVTAVVFPLYLADEKMKGVVLVAFGKSHNEHRSFSIPDCLYPDPNGSSPTIGKITNLYYDCINIAAGCHFHLENECYVTEGGYSWNVKQVTFYDGSGSFGVNLLGFDVRRLLRAWFQELLEWTRSVTGDSSEVEKSRNIKEIKASLGDDVKYCLEFMSLDPQVELGKKRLPVVPDRFKVSVRESFGLVL